MTSYPIEISVEAEIDADKAGQYYDSKVPGLSLQFLHDLEESVQSISNILFPFILIRRTPLSGAAILLFFLMPFTLSLKTTL